MQLDSRASGSCRQAMRSSSHTATVLFAQHSRDGWEAGGTHTVSFVRSTAQISRTKVHTMIYRQGTSRDQRLESRGYRL